jgi:hypothetical protein
MTGINVIQGRVSLSANLMAAAIKRSGRYNYRVRKLDDAECVIEFFEVTGGKAESIGMSTFTKAQATAAGTKNMDKFPRNMLFARAMSNGVRWYCPDITGGPVYTPEELGANVNEEGEVINSTATVVIPPAEPEQTLEAPDNNHDPDAEFDELEPAMPDPSKLKSMDKLMSWAMRTGAFESHQHGLNAWDVLKREQKPQTFPQMRGLWIADVLHRAGEKRNQPALIEDEVPA